MGASPHVEAEFVVDVSQRYKECAPTSVRVREAHVLKPFFKDNREEFDRLHRRQIYIVIGSGPGAFVLAMAFILLGATQWIQWVAVPLVFVIIGLIGVLEVMKLLVFRKDLREQRESCEAEPPPDGNPDPAASCD